MSAGIGKMYILGIVTLLMNYGLIYNLGTIIQPPNVDPKEDAKTIFLATDRDVELMRILPQRRWSHRIAIAEEYKKIDPKNPLIPDRYVPLRGDPFRDLVFVLTTNPDHVFVAFLHAALTSTTPEIFGTVVTKIFIEFDGEEKLIMNAYDRYVESRKSLLLTIFASKITKEYKNFLQHLLQRDRKFSSTRWRLNVNENKRVSQLANMLVREQRGWGNNRMILDYILMNKSIRLGRLVIMEFNWVNPVGEDILTAIDNHIPDNNVKLGYKYLVKYVFDRYLSDVDLIHGNKNEPYHQHAIHILFIAWFSEFCLHEIDVLFIQKYDQCISEYLLSKNNTDTVNQMLAGVAKGDDCRSSKRDAAGDGLVFGTRKWDF